MINDIHRERTRLVFRKQIDSELPRNEPSPFARRRRPDKRRETGRKRSPPKFLLNRFRKREAAIPEPTLLPMNARPEFPQNAGFSEGEGGLPDVLIGRRMGENDHASL